MALSELKEAQAWRACVSVAYFDYSIMLTRRDLAGPRWSLSVKASEVTLLTKSLPGLLCGKPTSEIAGD